MMNKNRIVYAEVYSFINSLPVQQYKKIPDDVVNYIDWHRDYNYEFNYDYTKTIDEQNFSKEAVAMILKIYLEYFADKDERKNVNSIIYKNDLKKNDELMKKYNPDNIFKKDNRNTQIPNNEEVSMIDVKSEKWYKRIITFFKNLIIRK